MMLMRTIFFYLIVSSSPALAADIPVDSPRSKHMATDYFDTAIAAFEVSDALSMPEPGSILFTGSSSIYFWKSLATDMAPLTVINRGFGGSHIHQVNHYFDRIVTPYAPPAIVFYCGENDLSGMMTPEATLAEFQRFMDLKDKALGDTPVYFIAIKPSVSRWAQFDVQTTANAMVMELANSRDDLTYIDVVAPMLDGGLPKDIFVEDNLHLNADGYRIWTDTVRPVLLESISIRR